MGIPSVHTTEDCPRAVRGDFFIFLAINHLQGEEARRNHIVQMPKRDVVSLRQKRGINTPPSSSAKELANIGPDILSAAKSLTLG